jgi:hypothetical protein
MPAGALDAGFNTCSNKSAKVCNKRGVNESPRYAKPSP